MSILRKISVMIPCFLMLSGCLATPRVMSQVDPDYEPPQENTEVSVGQGGGRQSPYVNHPSEQQPVVVIDDVLMETIRREVREEMARQNQTKENMENIENMELSR